MCQVGRGKGQLYGPRSFETFHSHFSYIQESLDFNNYGGSAETRLTRDTGSPFPQPWWPVRPGTMRADLAEAIEAMQGSLKPWERTVWFDLRDECLKNYRSCGRVEVLNIGYKFV